MPKVIDSGTLRVTFHYEDGGWWAESPDIPRWSAAAGTFAEACKLVAEGIPFAKEKPTTVALTSPADGPPNEAG